LIPVRSTRRNPLETAGFHLLAALQIAWGARLGKQIGNVADSSERGKRRRSVRPPRPSRPAGNTSGESRSAGFEQVCRLTGGTRHATPQARAFRVSSLSSSRRVASQRAARNPKRYAGNSPFHDLIHNGPERNARIKLRSKELSHVTGQESHVCPTEKHVDRIPVNRVSVIALQPKAIAFSDASGSRAAIVEPDARTGVISGRCSSMSAELARSSLRWERATARQPDFGGGSGFRSGGPSRTIRFPSRR
jgi:hypothetical protein